jgi:hypothetical protein
MVMVVSSGVVGSVSAPEQHPARGDRHHEQRHQRRHLVAAHDYLPVGVLPESSASSLDGATVRRHINGPK